jgi:hypothetical protein
MVNHGDSGMSNRRETDEKKPDKQERDLVRSGRWAKGLARKTTSAA